MTGKAAHVGMRARWGRPLLAVLVLVGCGDGPGGPAVRLADQSAERNLVFEHHAPTGILEPAGTGAAFADCDGDGWLDLFVTRRIGPNALFRSDGAGHFVEEAGAAGVADPDGDCRGAAFADYDNDGVRDLFVARQGTSRLYRGLGDCRFEDVTERAGVGGEGSTQSAAWGDYDGDGWLDLYVTSYTNRPERPLPTDEPERQDHLFHSRRDGTFEDVSHLLGVASLGDPGFAAAFVDVDDDRDPDLYVVNDALEHGIHNRLFLNDGAGGGADSWSFTDASSASGAALSMNGMGVAPGDYDNDGDLDVVVTDIGRPALLRNDGSGHFVEVGEAAGLDRGLVYDDQWVTWGVVFVDLDNDGWQDLYVAAGGLLAVLPQPNAVFRNLGDGRFDDLLYDADSPDAPALMSDDSNRTVAAGDVDGDGFVDLFVVTYAGNAALWRTEPNGNHWLTIELQGTRSNRDGIGARITVTPDEGPSQVREVRSGSSLGAGHDIGAHFGLGPVDQAVHLRVQWPSGVDQQLDDVPIDRRTVVVEPGG